MLEAVASKKPAVICGYNENVTLITKDKLDTCIEENFGGYTLKDDIDEVFRYDEEKMKKNLEECYQYIRKELSISNSVYLDIKPFPNKFNMEYYFSDLNKLSYDWDRYQELKWLVLENYEMITDEAGHIVALEAKAKKTKRISSALRRRIKWITRKNQGKKSKK